MEKLLAGGKVKAIGVCNYSKPYLEALLAEAKVVPAVNQIENHPSLPQDEIVDLCKAKGIQIMAYSPFGSTGAPMFTAPAVVKVAEKHGVSAGTVLLSYHSEYSDICSVRGVESVKILTSSLVARGSTVLAKSTSNERIKSNLNTVTLDAEDVKALADYSADLLAKGELKRYVYPPFKTQFGFPDKL